MPPTLRTGMMQSGSGPLLPRATLLKGALDVAAPQHAPDAMHVTTLQAGSMARQAEQSAAHQAAASQGCHAPELLQLGCLCRPQRPWVQSGCKVEVTFRWVTGFSLAQRSRAGQGSCSAASMRILTLRSPQPPNPSLDVSLSAGPCGPHPLRLPTHRTAELLLSNTPPWLPRGATWPPQPASHSALGGRQIPRGMGPRTSTPMGLTLRGGGMQVKLCPA